MGGAAGAVMGGPGGAGYGPVSQTPYQAPALQSSAQSAPPLWPGLHNGSDPNAPGNQLPGVPTNNPPAAAPPPPGPPPPYQAPPSFMTPALQQYVNQFQQSQAAQQQAMNAGLVQALQGLGSRRDAAAKVAATLPGQYEQAYTQATQAGQAAANTAGKALNLGPGVPAASGATQQAAAGDLGANAAVNAAGREGGIAGQPLLQAGINADYSKGATTLANTNMQNQASVDQQQGAFDQQLALAQAGYTQGVNMANLNSSLGVQAWKQENPNAALTPAQQQAAVNQQAQDAQAIKFGFVNYAQQQQTQASAPYAEALAAINGQGLTAGMQRWGMHGTPSASDMIRYLQENNVDVLKALYANSALTQPGTTAAGAAIPPSVIG